MLQHAKTLKFELFESFYMIRVREREVLWSTQQFKHKI